MNNFLTEIEEPSVGAALAGDSVAFGILVLYRCLNRNPHRPVTQWHLEGSPELMGEASPNTIKSYRDTFRQFLVFVQQQHNQSPSSLNIEQVDAH